MNKNKSNESRRKLLKSLAAGSGVVIAGKSLPESWSRLVVDSVMLSAHAQTSNTTIYSGNSITTAALKPENGNMLAKLLNTVIPTASAQGGPSSIDACITVNGESITISLRGFTDRGQIIDIIGTGPIEGPVTLTGSLPCDTGIIDDDGEATIVSRSDTEIVLGFTGPETVETIRIPAATSCIPFRGCPPPEAK